MALFTHISIAILSLVYTGYLYYSPSKTKFYITYILTTLGFITGFYLVWGKPAYLIKAFLSGFFKDYLKHSLFSVQSGHSLWWPHHHYKLFLSHIEISAPLPESVTRNTSFHFLVSQDQKH